MARSQAHFSLASWSSKLLEFRFADIISAIREMCFR